jgi:hypothetical protein
MLPNLSRQDHSNGSPADVELSSKFAIRHIAVTIQPPNLLGLLKIQFHALNASWSGNQDLITRKTRRSTFTDCIAVVDCRRSKKEMGRSDTGRIVAVVTDVQRSGILSVFNHPGHTVSADPECLLSVPNSKPPVALQALAHPHPAVAVDIDLRPEHIHKKWGNLDLHLDLLRRVPSLGVLAHRRGVFMSSPLYPRAVP